MLLAAGEQGPVKNPEVVVLTVKEGPPEGRHGGAPAASGPEQRLVHDGWRGVFCVKLQRRQGAGRGNERAHYSLIAAED